MSALNDLLDHPEVPDPWNFDDPEARSWHEVVCSAARHMAQHPEHYDDVPLSVLDRLNEINEAVVRLAEVLQDF